MSRPTVAGLGQRRPPGEPRGLAWLQGLVILLAVLAFATPLTTGVGLVGAAGGTLAGRLAAPALARSRLRLLPGLLLAALGGLGGLFLAHELAALALPAWLLGPAAVLQLAEAGRWFTGAGLVVGGLGFASRRHGAFALVEALLALASLAYALAAHRDGAFHRPLLLGDWAWSRGVDPAQLLLLLGALAGLGAVPLLLGPRVGRLGRQLLSVALLALGIWLLVDAVGPPRPDLTGGAGLTGEQEEPGRGQGQRAGARAGQGGRGGGAGQGQGSGSSGGRDQPPREPFEFQDDTSSKGAETPVAVVIFHDDYRPREGYYYFRQVAFSQYNGRRLVQTTRADLDRDLPGGFPLQPTTLPAVPEDPGHHDRVRTTVALLAEHPRPLALVAAQELFPLPNPDRKRFVRLYGAVSVVPRRPLEELLETPAGDPEWTAEQAAELLQLPADPRYRALAEETIRILGARYRELPLPRALAVKRWLDANVIYSLQSAHARAEDPVADFLFGDRTGYCVHIAHAAVYLLRALGVPARVGGGYAVDATDARGGASLLLRGGNAHTWPEIYLRGHGWTVLDISPERVVSPPLQPPDPVLQRMLGEMARGESGGSPPPPAAEELAAESTWSLDPRLLAEALLVLLALGIGLLYAVKLWRRLAPLWGRGHEHTRLAYRAATDRLGEAGWRREPGEGRLAFARRVAPITAAYLPLSEAVVAACLGPRTAPPPPREAIVRWLAAQRRELATHTSRWRRWRGLLDPTSWTRSR